MQPTEGEYNDFQACGGIDPSYLGTFTDNKAETGQKSSLVHLYDDEFDALQGEHVQKRRRKVVGKEKCGFMNRFYKHFFCQCLNGMFTSAFVSLREVGLSLSGHVPVIQLLKWEPDFFWSWKRKGGQA